ncbi:MAG: hypothetical protein QOG23_2645 [Blastocatellia bacterium]|jgi:hypothetical protein|nr:hypothetical protein [Blastocatellia bacterium]MDX6499385.1 hypothetical protein [Blastocatellia bacterium]
MKSNESLDTGEWYFTVICSHCDQLLPFLKDSSDGKSEFMIDENFLSLTCPNCLTDFTCPVTSVRRHRLQR